MDSKSNAIQPHIEFIKTESEKVTNQYEEGMQLQRQAKQEAVGYEKYEGIKLLISKMDNAINSIKQTKDGIAEKALEAANTLKKVQQRERRKKTTIILSIIAILALLYVVFVRK